MTAAIRVYVMAAYAIFPLLPREAGTLNRRTSPSPMGTADQRTHGRALPQRVRVLSMRAPIPRSVTPSRSLVSSIMVPMTAALIPTLSV
ncbi:unknown [Clostridium clostridioforme CAG:132]|uniref:Uncharacterized protein n=1 Tax=[Clostridium] clostridioforme CAG:132 TaxID=1263065 RepID=R6KRA9_9FIRM|nr:unknown [[Clostridium] clostridioforme CAG:132]